MCVHVAPTNEKHTLEGLECSCGPRIIWVDEKDGQPYPNGPIVSHKARRLDDVESWGVYPEPIR